MLFAFWKETVEETDPEPMIQLPDGASAKSIVSGVSGVASLWTSSNYVIVAPA